MALFLLGMAAGLLCCGAPPRMDVVPTDTCGDDRIGVGEVCDGSALGSETCERRGFGEGVLRCAEDCKGFDTRGCSSPAPAVCGNGKVERGEACDDGYTDACGSCNATCSGAGQGAICGDSAVCPELEKCDDGNTVDDVCAADCSPWLFSCAKDAATMPGRGVRSIGPSNDMVPLCNGWVLVSDSTSNQVRLLNAFSGKEAAKYQLTARPDRLALDAARGVLYASLIGATRLARIDLQSGAVSAISLDSAATGLASAATAGSLAVAPSGRMFASLSVSGRLSAIAAIDADKQIVEKVWPEASASQLAFDGMRQQLVIGTGTELKRLQFDPIALTLAVSPSRGKCCGTNWDLSISPDGNHLAYPCGCGNAGLYTITDYSSEDLSMSSGEWNIGAYPSAAGFSPDNQLVAASNRQDLKMFSVATHGLIKSERHTGCAYDDVRRIGFSRGGKYVFTLMQCGFDRDSGQLEWTTP